MDGWIVIDCGRGVVDVEYYEGSCHLHGMPVGYSSTHQTEGEEARRPSKRRQERGETTSSYGGLCILPEGANQMITTYSRSPFPVRRLDEHCRIPSPSPSTDRGVDTRSIGLPSSVLSHQPRCVDDNEVRHHMLKYSPLKR